MGDYKKKILGFVGIALLILFVIAIVTLFTNISAGKTDYSTLVGPWWTIFIYALSGWLCIEMSR